MLKKMMLPLLVIVPLLSMNAMASGLPGSQPQELERISIAMISGTVTSLVQEVEKMAKEKNAGSWKITSLRIDGSSYVTAILYK